MPEALQHEIDSHSTHTQVQTQAQPHFDADDHAHLDEDPEETQGMPGTDDPELTMVSSPPIHQRTDP